MKLEAGTKAMFTDNKIKKSLAVYVEHPSFVSLNSNLMKCKILL